MESNDKGWRSDSGATNLAIPSIVERIHNVRHEISNWRKANKPYGKDRIMELQQALEAVQNDDNRTQEELAEITIQLSR